jgi:hypothetical protein
MPKKHEPKIKDAMPKKHEPKKQRKNNGYFDARQIKKTMGTLMPVTLERKDSPYFQTKFEKREMRDIGVHKNTKIFHTLALLLSKSMTLPFKDPEFNPTTYTR